MVGSVGRLAERWPLASYFANCHSIRCGWCDTGGSLIVVRSFCGVVELQ